CVDADAVLAALLGQAAGEVEGSGLRRRVGGGVRARYERVLRADEDDRAAPSLLKQDAECLARGEEVAARQNRVVPLPVLERRLSDGGARGETRRADEDVESAVREDGLPHH